MADLLKSTVKITRSQETADALISLILSRNMKAGDRLPNEQTLCEALNIGRGTLREAVKQLSSRNILEVHQGSGTYVSDKRGIPSDPLGVTFLKNNKKLALDLIEARLALEPQIAMLAAENATEEDIAHMIELRDLHKEAIYSGGNYQDVDTQFHAYVAQCSGNAIFTNLVPIIASSVQVSTTIVDMEYRKISARCHHLITECIARHDGLGAYNAMLTHLNVSREYFISKED
ncbi:MAG: FadR family transcriptional regulator [Oscillibacter sp.]|jgi:DNA-binding FadR family transcriptional regulator|nr:FadR family transcriptional regulator [Oscillibacter sp.]